MAEEAYPAEPTHPMPEDEDVKDDEEEEKDMMTGKVQMNQKCGYRTCSILAHNKMVLHSLKHLSRPIFGVLIGITYKHAKSGETYCHIMDAIPLQHNFYSSMVIEVAFLQIQQWLDTICKAKDIKSKNLRVLGVYFANNNNTNVDKDTSAIIIASQLIKQYSRTSVLLCQVVSDRIGSSYKGEDSAADWYMVCNNGDSETKRDWKAVDDVYLVQTERPDIQIKHEFDENKYQDWLLNMQQLKHLDVEQNKFTQLNLKQLLKDKAEDNIYDFDDHLEDQSKDWRNLQLFNL